MNTTPRRRPTGSFTDKAKNRAEEVGDKAKEVVGDKTDSDDLMREGQAVRATSGVEQTGENAKDTFGRC